MTVNLNRNESSSFRCFSDLIICRMDEGNSENLAIRDDRVPGTSSSLDQGTSKGNSCPDRAKNSSLKGYKIPLKSRQKSLRASSVMAVRGLSDFEFDDRETDEYGESSNMGERRASAEDPSDYSRSDTDSGSPGSSSSDSDLESEDGNPRRRRKKAHAVHDHDAQRKRAHSVSVHQEQVDLYF